MKSDQVEQVLQDYVRGLSQELHERWIRWKLDLSKKETHEVIGAQAILVTNAMIMATGQEGGPKTA